MSRSKSLVLVFSSLCALAACARIPAPNETRRPTQPIVVQEPMGNPSATVESRPRVDPEHDRRLMEPELDSAPSQALMEPEYDRAPIQNLEDPSADSPPTVTEEPEVAPEVAPAPTPAPAPVDPNDELTRRKPTVPIIQPSPDEIVGPGSR